MERDRGGAARRGFPGPVLSGGMKSGLSPGLLFGGSRCKEEP
jgi:hypothetical protein